MDFDALVLLDITPTLLELVLHLSPNSQGLFVEFLDFGPGGLLQLVETEFALDDGRLLHQKFQLTVGTVGFVTTPILLNVNGSQHWSIRSLEFLLGILDGFPDLLSVSYTRKQVIIS